MEICVSMETCNTIEVREQQSPKESHCLPHDCCCFLKFWWKLHFYPQPHWIVCKVCGELHFSCTELTSGHWEMFIYFCTSTCSIVRVTPGGIHITHIFMAVLNASSLIYICEKSPVISCVRPFQFCSLCRSINGNAISRI